MIYLSNYKAYLAAVSERKMEVKLVLVENREKHKATISKSQPAPLSEEQKQAKAKAKAAHNRAKRERKKLRLAKARKHTEIENLKTEAQLQALKNSKHLATAKVVVATVPSGKTLPKIGANQSLNRKQRRALVKEIAAPGGIDIRRFDNHPCPACTMSPCRDWHQCKMWRAGTPIATR